MANHSITEIDQLELFQRDSTVIRELFELWEPDKKGWSGFGAGILAIFVALTALLPNVAIMVALIILTGMTIKHWKQEYQMFFEEGVIEYGSIS